MYPATYVDLDKTASGRSAIAMILAALAGMTGGRVLGDSQIRDSAGRQLGSWYRNDLAPIARSGGQTLADWYRQDLAPALRSGGVRAEDWYRQAVAPRIEPEITRMQEWATREITPRVNSAWTTLRSVHDSAFGR